MFPHQTIPGLACICVAKPPNRIALPEPFQPFQKARLKDHGIVSIRRPRRVPRRNSRCASRHFYRHIIQPEHRYSLNNLSGCQMRGSRSCRYSLESLQSESPPHDGAFEWLRFVGGQRSPMRMHVRARRKNHTSDGQSLAVETLVRRVTGIVWI